jgi:hypothetical protein
MGSPKNIVVNNIYCILTEICVISNRKKSVGEMSHEMPAMPIGKYYQKRKHS